MYVWEAHNYVTDLVYIHVIASSEAICRKECSIQFDFINNWAIIVVNFICFQIVQTEAYGAYYTHTHTHTHTEYESYRNTFDLTFDWFDPSYIHILHSHVNYILKSGEMQVELAYRGFCTNFRIVCHAISR